VSDDSLDEIMPTKSLGEPGEQGVEGDAVDIGDPIEDDDGTISESESEEEDFGEIEKKKNEEAMNDINNPKLTKRQRLALMQKKSMLQSTEHVVDKRATKHQQSLDTI
jgi:hypothetical protein